MSFIGLGIRGFEGVFVAAFGFLPNPKTPKSPRFRV